MKTDATEALETNLGHRHAGQPSRRDIELAIALRAMGGDRPEPIPFEERDDSEPRAVAQRIWDQDLGPGARAELIENAYGKLAQAVYPTRREFQAAVDAAVYAIQHPNEFQHMPKAVPIFELGEQRMLTPGPHHDLEKLFEEMRPAAARLLELSALPHEGPVEWTGRLLKGWYAKAYWENDAARGHGRIRVNRCLGSA